MPNAASLSRNLWLAHLSVLDNLSHTNEELCLLLIQHLLCTSRKPRLLELKLLLLAARVSNDLVESRTYLRAADAHEAMARFSFEEDGILTDVVGEYLDSVRDEIVGMKAVASARGDWLAEHEAAVLQSSLGSDRQQTLIEDEIQERGDEEPGLLASGPSVPDSFRNQSHGEQFELFLEGSRKHAKRTTLYFAKELWEQFKTPPTLSKVFKHR